MIKNYFSPNEMKKINNNTDEILSDVYHALELIESVKDNKYSEVSSFSTYDKIYPDSNEYLKNILNSFDMKDKEVLSVAASGDPIFEFLNRDVKSVEMFDINKLVKYYFYLRSWIIKFFDKYYVSKQYLFDITVLNRLFNNVSCESVDEQNALNFWMTIVSKVENPFMLKHLFRDSDGYNKYNNVSDLLEIKKRLKNDNIKFHHCSLKDIDSIKKFDVIYLSNILEYCREYVKDLELHRDKLFELLKDNGVVLCSRLRSQTNDVDSILEMRIFESNFKCIELSYTCDYMVSPGYMYVKK